MIKKKNIAYVFSRSLLLTYLALLVDTGIRYLLETNHLFNTGTFTLPFDTERSFVYNLILVTFFSLFKWGHILTLLIIFYAVVEPNRYLLRLLIFFSLMANYFGIFLVLFLKSRVLPEEYITTCIIASILIASIPKTIEATHFNKTRSHNQ